MNKLEAYNRQAKKLKAEQRKQQLAEAMAFIEGCK